MRKVVAVTAAFLALAAGQAWAQDARYMAAVCANCHGTDGKAVSGGAVAGLAGLSRSYFIEQMTAFKTDKCRATIMHQIAKGFTDQQIAVLADYFSAQKK